MWGVIMQGRKTARTKTGRARGPANKTASVGREGDLGVPGQEGSLGKEHRASSMDLVTSHLGPGLDSEGK